MGVAGAWLALALGITACPLAQYALLAALMPLQVKKRLQRNKTKKSTKNFKGHVRQ